MPARNAKARRTRRAYNEKVVLGRKNNGWAGHPGAPAQQGEGRPRRRKATRLGPGVRLGAPTQQEEVVPAKHQRGPAVRFG